MSYLVTLEGVKNTLGGWFLDAFIDRYRSNLGKYKDRKSNTYYTLKEFRESFPRESFEEIYDYIRELYKNDPSNHGETYAGMREFIRAESVSQQSAAAAAAAAAQEEKRAESMVILEEHEPEASVSEEEIVIQEGDMNQNIELPEVSVSSLPEYNLLWEDSESITYEDESGNIHTEAKAKSGAGWLLVAAAGLLFLI